MKRLLLLLFFCLSAGALQAQTFQCEEGSLPDAPPVVEGDRYAWMAEKHRLHGTASYYSDFFDGRKTASGEIFHQARFTAAHRTLPLGCWAEVRSIATGKQIRVKVNDRGPFSGGFTLDLSRAAAHALGVDYAPDRRVEIRILALPGEELPEDDPEQSAAASR